MVGQTIVVSSQHLTIEPHNIMVQRDCRTNIISKAYHTTTYFEFSTRRLFCDIQLTLQSTLPWSLQIVNENLPKFALTILIMSPVSHSIVSVLSSHAYAVPSFGTGKKKKERSVVSRLYSVELLLFLLGILNKLNFAREPVAPHEATQRQSH